jgi:hypothetical protein
VVDLMNFLFFEREVQEKIYRTRLTVINPISVVDRSANRNLNRSPLSNTFHNPVSSRETIFAGRH